MRRNFKLRIQSYTTRHWLRSIVCLIGEEKLAPTSQPISSKRLSRSGLVAFPTLMTVFLFLLWLLNENFWYSRLFLLAVAAVFRHSSKCTCVSFIFTARCIKSLAKCKLSNTVQSSLVFTQRKESSTATGFDWKYLWHCSKFIRHLGPRRRCFWSLSTATNRNGSETSIPGKCDNNRLLKNKQPIVH